MMQIIPSNLNIDFVGKIKLCATVSAFLVIASWILSFTRMQYGVDFTGGAEIQVKFAKAVEVAKIRKTLESAGVAGGSVISIGEASENEYLVRVPGTEDTLNKIEAAVEQSMASSFKDDGVQIRKVDIVGPKAGAQLRLSGFLALAWSLIAIMVYVGLRFDFKYAPGAIIALIHDVSIVCGAYALFGIEFNLQTIAAILTVIGYSVNDTVIVYDRIRENAQKNIGETVTQHINKATNETLSRTVLTVATTLFSSIAMLIFGGPAIFNFFFATTIGILVGTYSSIYIASPTIMLLDEFYASRDKKNQKDEGHKVAVPAK